MDGEIPNLLAHFNWVQGLKPRLEQARAAKDAERAWTEIRQGMIVGYYTPAHRRGKERKLGGLYKLSNLILRIGVGRALPDDHERLLGAAKGLNRSFYRRLVNRRARRVRDGRRIADKLLIYLT